MDKKCSRCEGIKSLDEFYNSKGGKHGKSNYCKQCIYEVQGLDWAHKQENLHFLENNIARCSRCRLVKPLDQFTLTGGKDKKGRPSRGRCKTCTKLKNKQSYWRNLTKERTRSRAKKYDPVKRRCKLLRDFGISVEQYEYLASKGCGVCGKMSDKDRRLAVDHCHTTQVVRGVLCMRCNLAIGYLADSTERINKVIHYLQNHADIPPASYPPRHRRHKRKTLTAHERRAQTDTTPANLPPVV